MLFVERYEAWQNDGEDICWSASISAQREYSRLELIAETKQVTDTRVLPGDGPNVLKL